MEENPARSNRCCTGRRSVLRHGAAAAGVVLLYRAGFIKASAGQASKSDFHYQDHPRDGHRCADCAAFIPPPEGVQEPACKIVSGPISPNGWCMAFSGK